MERGTGILLHITSLPGREGIGVLGDDAKAIIRDMRDMGIKYWQILPLGHTSFGDSPYFCFSAFAGNPLLISLDELKNNKLIEEIDYESLQDREEKVDYGKLYKKKYALLREAYSNFVISNEYIIFEEKHKFWLDEYSLFMAIKENQGGLPFKNWKREFRKKDKNAIEAFKSKNEKEMGFWKFLQYIFYKQWNGVKSYANKLGIRIIGDIPIYVAEDSADLWGRPENFITNKEGEVLKVAGCPPDIFSEDGQYWGNPIYDWKYMKNDSYGWWRNRLEFSLEVYDIIRLDHFRGFAKYWAIESKYNNSREGKWEIGPGLDLFENLNFSNMREKCIAEDLGMITEDVIEMREKLGFPGMKILEFAFNGDKNNPYLPHNLERESVLYIGTHDNNTLVGWLEENREDKSRLYEYLGLENWEEIDKIFRIIIGSVSKICVFQMQDLLLKGEECRMNIPSTNKNNWQWRMKKNELSEETKRKIYNFNMLYGRI